MKSCDAIKLTPLMGGIVNFEESGQDNEMYFPFGHLHPDISFITILHPIC